jgi:acetyl-CoA carboxylase biotin carboxyl carrier protein
VKSSFNYKVKLHFKYEEILGIKNFKKWFNENYFNKWFAVLYNSVKNRSREYNSPPSIKKSVEGKSMFGGSPILALEEIESLAKILRDNDLGEIDIEYKDTKISIKSKREQKAMPQVYEPITVQTRPDEVATPASTPISSGKTVKAPIVGTFYASPAPDKPPFVEVGKQVKKGDVIMIIESMKIMNEVTSDFDGTVKEILVKNGDPVEFDQEIFIFD